MPADTGGLSDALAHLPAQPMAALRVLELVEQPNASAAELARLIEMDPALSARVIRLANAPYYGLARRVASASRAVVLLGFSTVRALAVSAACSLIVEDGRQGPAGYWAHSIATASAASLVARHAGTPPADAFSAGLLHDVGTALLFRHDPEAHAAMIASVRAGAELSRAERGAFGRTHQDAGAEVLDLWRFPDEFVEAVADHHNDPAAIRTTLGKLVAAGEAIAASLAGGFDEPAGSVDDALWSVGVNASSGRMTAMARRELTSVAAFLQVDS